MFSSKKYFLIFTIILFNCSNLNAEDKTFYIDVDYLINNSIQGKLILKNLNEINKKNILLFRSSETELKKNEKEIEKIKNIISEEELKQKVKNLRNEIILYQDNKKNKKKEFNLKKNDELKKFIKKLSPIIEKFMKKNSIGIVLDKKNIFIADSKYDITGEILIIVNESLK